MMGMYWVVLFVALAGSRLGQGLPLRSTPPAYPHDTSGPSLLSGWGSEGVYAAVPALALVITAVGLLFGCTWCYRHKDCKLFAANATHLHDARRSQPPDSGFSEPANNNISEDNNNGPISLREMQNIANNNAAAYIVSENEERNRVSRESVVEFEPLPSGIGAADPLEHCADWFGGEDLPRNRLQYLREIGRGWFGRVVEGEIEEDGATTTVAVKILNQNASLEDKARFLDEARVYRDVRHENILAFVTKCLQEDPWLLIFELCSMDLQQYLTANRSKMAALNESGVPLQLMCDVTAALAHLHSAGYSYGHLSSRSVLVRETPQSARAVLGSYAPAQPEAEFAAPEARGQPAVHTPASEVWALGTLLWEVCAWGEPMPHASHTPPPPDPACPYRNHLYQVMQLCWNPDAEARPTSAQVHALLNHLHSNSRADTPQDDGYGSSDFEERWQRLKPNTIPKVDEHVAIVHAPSTSMTSHFTSEEEIDRQTQDTLSVDMDTAVSRSSSIMSDKDPLSVQAKSESLTNLHGSLEDVRNIYLTHNETAVLDCHQGNMGLDDSREKEHDRSDSSMDPWLKDIIAGSQDDVSYYKDVSDVIKNLDNILNSEKTSSSESSHQASPSRDNLSLDCKKEYPAQSSMVKSPGISNFQNVLEMGFDAQDEPCEEDEVDRDTIGTLSHSFGRHSDSASQHTLENLTPDTPIRDVDFSIGVESPETVKKDLKDDILVHKVKELKESSYEDAPIEKVERSDSKLPNLKDLCVASLSSVSENEQLNVREDCKPSCDSNLAEIVRTEEVKTKSIDNTILDAEESSTPISPVKEVFETYFMEVFEPIESLNKVEKVEEKKNGVEKAILPYAVREIAEDMVEKEILLPAIEFVARIKHEDEEKESNNELIKDVSLNASNETKDVQQSDLIQSFETTFDESKEPVPIDEEMNKILPLKEAVETLEILNTSALISTQAHISPTQTPEPVQNIDSNEAFITESIETEKADTTSIVENEIAPVLPSGIVQESNQEPIPTEIEDIKDKIETANEDIALRSVTNAELTEDLSHDSTAYMDLINNTNCEIKKDETMDSNLKEVIQACLDQPNNDSTCFLVKNESTVYLDLPSVLKETHDFLHSERVVSSHSIDVNSKMCASTPKGSDISTDNTLECSEKHEAELSETKVPDGFLTKFEAKCVADTLSPFDSPTKSHPTDTYDENSSVVLGSFENCTLELRGIKSEVDLPKEELLAFSSNFSEMNLETPSPLRDGNFLNEVPDIVHDDLQFDDVTVSEGKPSEPQTENTDETDQSGTTKRVSPSTPPNSPGIFLASTSQQKYLVDIDLEPEVQSYPPIESDSGLSSLQKEIDLNQIELQITSKLAMAENENNLNIEYSGPLTVEGLISDEVVVRESDAIPESVLAGNGGSVEDLREGFTLDEECVKALRNELELKLPLAQVAAIEPAVEAEWSELPPPPELVVSYCGAVGALSPIAEETRHQLSAYENDAWNTSTRTDSSESYPEPCNNSTDEVTDLPTAAPPSSDHSTYTIHSEKHQSNETFTIQKDIPSSKEFTMSADSLNGSPYKKPNDQSPVDDRTYNKNDDEKESNCERISQVSPFLMSPTTDTSAPVDSENVDNATGVSTLSKTTVPTDAKLSKPSECLSKATSIDSWCSNDTLYNVEENFDDLALDPDVLLDFEKDKSESSDTLTHNDDEKELSHCSTYIIHDSRSEVCETFSPDSITANDNYTYTKVKTEATGASPSVVTKSELDSKNTQTKDLAYGTLPTYSNCTTELISGIEDPWKVPQPELVRRSPIGEDVNLTPPRFIEDKKKDENESPLTSAARIKKIDSIDITCLQDESIDSQNKIENYSKDILVEINDSPNYNYKDMAPSVTSTPLVELAVDNDNDETIPMVFPNDRAEKTVKPDTINNIPNFQMFMMSAEIRPQDISSNSSSELVSTNQEEVLLEGDSRNSKDSVAISERTPTYSDFMSSAVLKPQDVKEKSSQSIESAMSSGEFRQFENSVRNRPQDISSVIDASSLFLTSEIMRSCNSDETSQNVNHELNTLDISPPKHTNLEESHEIGNRNDHFDMFITDIEEETEQPHSIIITEMPVDISVIPKAKVTAIPNNVAKESPNTTFDSHTEAKTDFNHTYDSHSKIVKENGTDDVEQTQCNGEVDVEDHNKSCIEDKKINSEETSTDIFNVTSSRNLENEIPNGSVNLTKENFDVKCNGNSEKFAIVNFLNETFEELMESNVDDDSKDIKNNEFSELVQDKSPHEDIEIQRNEVSNLEVDAAEKQVASPLEDLPKTETVKEMEDGKVNGQVEDKVAAVTDNFLKNEQKFCQVDYLPLLSDIRFTGPASEIMSTSFTQDSPTEPTSPECEQDSKPDTAAEILKEWDSDSESQSSNSSSGEFIWKDGEGHETAVVPSTHFDHQRSGSQPAPEGGERGDGGVSDASGDSGSGSEGDEVEFVPSSWDCRAAPAKSSLRSLEQAPDSKKRVVFKRQKYHCVYEYPREVVDVDSHSPAYLPDLSTYCEWDPTSAEDAELGYGQLFGAPSPLDKYCGISFGSDYDEDFFISSSARPFESLGVMTTTSQFFPGMHIKPVLERELSDDVTEEFPPPPSPLPAPTLLPTRTPSLDFTTPDSGVEDITPGSTSTDEDFKTKKLPETDLGHWRPADSGSSSESVSPSSPGGEALGGLRHTRDKLKLDLPPSPHIPSPRHNRVFNFVLDKPKRRVPDERPAEVGTTPLVMTDETPVITTSLPLQKDEEVEVPEPTFSTFGKSTQKSEESEQKIILTDDVENEVKVETESPVKTVEPVKGEGTVLDSGDEDSGIESSSKATLERNKTVS